MDATANLEALRAAAVVVLGAGHHTVKAIDRAIEAHDAAVSERAYHDFRRLPGPEQRAILALVNCPTWLRRNAEAAIVRSPGER
jgi:hypothetical protein